VSIAHIRFICGLFNFIDWQVREKNSFIGSLLSKYSKWFWSLNEKFGDVTAVSKSEFFEGASPKLNLLLAAFLVVYGYLFIPPPIYSPDFVCG
jgi:hypothetical protein